MVHVKRPRLHRQSKKSNQENSSAFSSRTIRDQNNMKGFAIASRLCLFLFRAVVRHSVVGGFDLKTDVRKNGIKKKNTFT